MNWFIIGTTFDVMGKVLIGITVLIVHRHVLKEHRITKDVLKQMRKEQILGLLGIVFILIGYFIHILAFKGV